MRHQAVALVHLAHHPLQRHHRLVRLGDHRRQQMRDVLVDRELDHLGIDHDDLALVGRQPVEQRQDHRVDRDRLARARGAGDQQVRHAREIDHHRLAADVLAERQRQRGGGVLVGGARQKIAQIDGLALIVGQLDADHVAPRHGGDAHRHRAERARDVVGERDHARGAGARRRLELVERDHRAGAHIDDLAADAEIVEHLLERPGGLGEARAIHADPGALARRGEETERRQLELVVRDQLRGCGRRLRLERERRRFGGLAVRRPRARSCPARSCRAAGAGAAPIRSPRSPDRSCA